MPYSDPIKQKEAQREHYLKNKADYYQRSKDTRVKRARRVDELKNSACMDCKGIFPPCVMDFDHRDQKTKVNNVSNLIRTGSWREILEEIAKCDVVCANCHRIRTQRQAKQNYLALSASGLGN